MGFIHQKYKLNENKDTLQVNGDSRVIPGLFNNHGNTIENGSSCNHLYSRNYDNPFCLHLGANQKTFDQ